MLKKVTWRNLLQKVQDLYEQVEDITTKEGNIEGEIPTDNSQLTNGAGYITTYSETDPTVPTHVKNISTTDISTWNSKADAGDIPTNNTQLTNGAGYITATTGFTGSFATATDTITVTNGLITAVTPI